MKFRFPIVIIDEDYRAENTSGFGIRALAQAIEAEGFEVAGATSYGDLSQFAQQQSRASAFILSIDDEEFSGGPDTDPAVLNLRNFIQEVRRKNEDVPIYLHGETKTSQHLPNDILRELHGFIHMFEDTPEFVAKHIIREAKSYLEGIQPPFFKALLDYAEDGSFSWHCPGHSGGVAFLKSPIGQMYHQFYGENMLRADVCNAVEELGQLLDHNGAIGESERNAARIFNADHCFFVTNGTSTSNKMVWHHTVAPGDVVVVDRNCHKSNLHAIIMTGAIPVFLKPTRNHFGIIGPIPKSEFEPEAIKAKIRANPLLKHVDADTVKPRILTLTQSTYDGVLYDTEAIKGMLDGYVDIGVTDVLVPFVSAYRPLWLGLGTVALDLLLAVLVTSLLRARLGHRAWRAVHRLAYASWPVALVHGIGIGTDTGTDWMTWLTVCCVAAVAAAAGLRLAHSARAARRTPAALLRTAEGVRS